MGQQYIYWKDSQKETKKYKDKYSLPINFGENQDGDWIIRDLSDIENILISGGTSTGKSNFLDTVICSLTDIYDSEELKIVLIDCKIGLFHYIKLPHLLYPITESMDEALTVLRKCLNEIGERKENKTKEPKILIVIDELADIMLNEKESEGVIYQIAKQGAQVGVHMLLSSSGSAPKVFPPRLKEVITTRLAGAMATETDSINLLDNKGAEELKGNGDMIYKDTSGSIRVQTPFITYDEQKEVLNKLSQTPNDFYPEIDKEDDLYKEAFKLIEQHDRVYIYLLCENLNIGYYRAVQLLEMVTTENDKREGLYEDALELYEKGKNVNAVGISKKLKIHYDRAKELMKKIKKEKGVKTKN